MTWSSELRNSLDPGDFMLSVILPRVIQLASVHRSENLGTLHQFEGRDNSGHFNIWNILSPLEVKS
jgi:hypothetical protein